MLGFDVAGWTFRFHGSTTRLHLPGLKATFAPASDQTTTRGSTAEGDEIDLAVDLIDAPAVPEPTGTVRFDSLGVWRLWDTADGPCFTLGGRQDPPWLKLQLDPSLRTGRIVLAVGKHFATGPVDPLPPPLDVVLTGHLLASRGVVLLHACGVVDSQGRGWALFGPSGAGKTTFATVAARAGWTVLSDERVALDIRPSAPRIHGTPYAGQGGLGAPRSAPLWGALALRHGPKAIVERTPTWQQAMAQLLPCVFLPTWWPDCALKVTRALTELARTAVHTLTFAPDAAALAALDPGLEPPRHADPRS